MQHPVGKTGCTFARMEPRHGPRIESVNSKPRITIRTARVSRLISQRGRAAGLASGEALAIIATENRGRQARIQAEFPVVPCSFALNEKA